MNVIRIGRSGNWLADQQKAMANVQTIPTDPRTQIFDPAQVTGGKRRGNSTVSAERARIPDRSRVIAGDTAKQQRPAPRQLQSGRLAAPMAERLDKAKMSGKASSHAVEATSPTPSPAARLRRQLRTRRSKSRRASYGVNRRTPRAMVAGATFPNLPTNAAVLDIRFRCEGWYPKNCVPQPASMFIIAMSTVHGASNFRKNRGLISTSRRQFSEAPV